MVRQRKRQGCLTARRLSKWNRAAQKEDMGMDEHEAEDLTRPKHTDVKRAEALNRTPHLNNMLNARTCPLACIV